MEISIRINGLMVEGIGPSTVKLTINNVDPFTFFNNAEVYIISIINWNKLNIRLIKVNDRGATNAVKVCGVVIANHSGHLYAYPVADITDIINQAFNPKADIAKLISHWAF